jgi:uncharacterized FlgJ-related protein
MKIKDFYFFNVKTLKMYEIKTKHLLIVFLGIFLLITLGLFFGKIRFSYEAIKETERRIIILEAANPFTKEKFIDKLTHSNIDFPVIVYAQGILESGNFESKLFRENNNMFGMRHPRVRPRTSLRDLNNYAYYRDWESAIDDMVMFQNYSYKGNRESYIEYFEWLDRGHYAEAGDYVIALKNIIKKDTLLHKMMKKEYLKYIKQMK